MSYDYNQFKGEDPVDQLLPECKAMASFALWSGKKLPAAVMEQITLVETVMESLKTGGDVPRLGFENQPMTLADCCAQLSGIHGRLCEIVSPAKPRSIIHLETERLKKGGYSFLGPVALIRRMMVVAVSSLFLLLAVSLSQEVDGDPGNFNFLENFGFSLFMNYLFLIVAAGLGASFSALYEANRYVNDGTFDPKYEQSYWNRFLLGVMAGLIMAFFIPTHGFEGENLQGMGKPLLAILGGFSASAVYRILNRIVSSLESMVKGDPATQMEAHAAQVNAKADERQARFRMDLTGQLSDLRGLMDKTTDPQVKKHLDKILNDLYGGRSVISEEADVAPGDQSSAVTEKESQETSQSPTPSPDTGNVIPSETGAKSDGVGEKQHSDRAGASA